MKEADTFLKVLILIMLSAHWCGGRTCDQHALTTCILRYMLDISTRMLEGMSHVCHEEERLKWTLNNCIKIRTPGCAPPLKMALETQAASAHKSLFDVLENMFCAPLPGCGILDILDCYKTEFDRLHIQQPYQSVNTPIFMDQLLPHLYRNQTAFCLTTLSVNFQAKVTCLTQTYRKLFETCKDDGVIVAGVTKQQSEQIFKNAVGQLGDVRLMQGSVRSMCSGGCDNFVHRYNRVQNCLKTFTSGLQHDFTKATVTQERKCSFLQQLYDCTFLDMQGCTALANLIEGNRHMRDMMRKCSIYFTSSAYTIYPHNILVGMCLLSALLALLTGTSILKSTQFFFS